MLRLTGTRHIERIARIDTQILQGRILLAIDEVDEPADAQFLKPDSQRSSLPSSNQLVRARIVEGF